MSVFIGIPSVLENKFLYMYNFLNMMTMKIVLILVFLEFCSIVECQTGANAKALRQKLFVTDGYDKKVRSANNQTNPTEVYVSFHLLSINELNEVTETLKTTGYLKIEWKDDFLTWPQADYGGISYSFFPQDDVWKPDVALKNSAVDYKQLGVSTLNVYVESTGDVSWYPFQMFQSSCSVDITYFPFDIQTCKVKFVAWSYTKHEVDMRAGSDGIDLSEFETNSEWEIIDSKATVEEESGEASIIFTLTIKRKPRYLFLSIIFPIIMLTILNLFVFVLPCDSGEKASYAITVFLAFAVFLTIVSGSLPENSDSMSLFSIYIIIQTIQSTLITVLALVFIRLYNLGREVPVPGWMIAVVKFLICLKCKSHTSTIKPTSYETNENDHIAKGDLNTSKMDLSSAGSVGRGVNVDEETYDWKRIVNNLDWFFLVCFSVLAFISTLLCLVLASALAMAP